MFAQAGALPNPLASTLPLQRALKMRTGGLRSPRTKGLKRRGALPPLRRVRALLPPLAASAARRTWHLPVHPSARRSERNLQRDRQLAPPTRVESPRQLTRSGRQVAAAGQSRAPRPPERERGRTAHDSASPGRTATNSRVRARRWAGRKAPAPLPCPRLRTGGPPLQGSSGVGKDKNASPVAAFEPPHLGA